MKRSEMLKELYKTMGAYESWEEQCEYMLQVCENMGMVPPQIRYWNRDKQGKLFYSSNNGDYLNLWENEE